VKVGICSVGAEITSGEVADENAAWLARRLGEVGCEIHWHVAVDDDEERIADAVRALAERCDAVVVGGGLGPTPDDRPRASIAKVVGLPLRRRDDLAATITDRFRAFGADMPASNLRQAEVPEGAEPFPPVGTAPGFRVDMERADGTGCAVYALPGVPWELRDMAEQHVLPDLLRRGGAGARVVRTVHVTGAGESKVAEILEPAVAAVEAEEGLEVSFLALPDEIQVRLTSAGPTPEAARTRVEPAVADIVRRLGPLASAIDDERVEEAVGRLLRLAGMTVATAESCTAGLVAARLSSVAGATDYLRGGIVAYATDVKSRLLGVPSDIVDEHGACARPTVEAMAARAREMLAADLGLAVVCVAGPAPQDGKEVGTTFWALATADGVRSWGRVVPGDRPTVTARAAAAALEALRRHLLATVGEGG
jgi:nicotinamide-nucleotide amidase